MGSIYWGHVMPGLGTPKVKIQVIDLEHLIDSRRAQMQWEPFPLHARAPGVYQGCSRTRVTDIRHPASCPLAAGQARALAGWPHA